MRPAWSRLVSPYQHLQASDEYRVLDSAAET